jgi:hypothetical protein
MAERKPLFISDNGYPEEIATTDSITLGALTMGGDIDMGSNNITNLAAPTSDTDAATKTYVDNATSQAEVLTETMAVSEAIAVADPVYPSAVDQVGKADAGTIAKAHVIGVATTAQATIGQDVSFVSEGVASGVLSGATVNTPYWLQNGGGIGPTLPSSPNRRLIRVGFAVNTTDLWVDVTDFGRRI